MTQTSIAFIRSWPSPVDLHFITGKFTGGKKTCLELANTYYSAVHRMGGDAYREAQSDCSELEASPVFSGSDFVKHGNNGTVSCNEFCVGSQWGDDQVGTCASAVLEGSPVSCSHVPGLLGGPELTCNCYQNATVRYGNNGTVNCNEFCGRTNETCLAAYDTLHERALSCGDVPGYLDGKHLKCSCMP